MDSSTLVEGSSRGPFESEAAARLGAGPESDPVEGTSSVRWLRRHIVSLFWVTPLLAVSVGVSVVILRSREAVAEPSVFTGGPSAVFFASLSAVLLWMIARRLHFSRPVAAATLLLFLFSPVSLTVHTSPTLQNAAVPLLLAGTLVVISRRVRTRLRMIALSAVGAALVLVVVFPLVVGGSASSESALLRWWNLDPALLILGAACSLIALALKRLRFFAAVSIVLMLLALRPSADLTASSVVVWLPLAVLLVGGVVQGAVQSAFDSDFPNLWQEVASGVFLVATVGVFIFAAPALAPGYRALLPSVLPPAAPSAARDAGAPGASGSTAVTPSAAPSPSVDPAAAAQSAAAGQSAARAAAGAELSDNPSLILGGVAEAELRAGDVDVRSILSLGQLLTTTEVAVDDFPALESEDGNPRRQILVSAVDGSSTSDDERLKDQLATYFMSLKAPLGGANVVGTDDGVLVIFPFGEPVELLPSTEGR